MELCIPTESYFPMEPTTAMEPRLVALEEKQLAGMHLQMSLARNRTTEVWKGFRPRVREIEGRVGDSFISMQVYGAEPGEIFSPETVFEKWAAIEVSTQENLPPGIEPYSLVGGLYAVFLHQGPASAAPLTMQQIFGAWLPASIYQLDDREHFEILPADYRPDDPKAREEIWIPIRHSDPQT